MGDRLEGRSGAAYGAQKAKQERNLKKVAKAWKTIGTAFIGEQPKEMHEEREKNEVDERLKSQEKKQVRKEMAQRNKQKELNRREKRLEDKQKKINQMEKDAQVDKAQLEKEKEELRKEQEEFENYKAKFESREVYREADQKFDAMCKRFGEEWALEYIASDGAERNISKIWPETIQIKEYTPDGYSTYTLYREDGEYYLIKQFEDKEPEISYGLTPGELFGEGGEEWPLVTFEKRINEAQNSIMKEDFLPFSENNNKSYESSDENDEGIA